MNKPTNLALLILIIAPFATGCLASMDGRSSAAGGMLAPPPSPAMIPADVTAPAPEVELPSASAPVALPVSGPPRSLPVEVAGPRLQSHMQCWVCR